MRQAIVHFVGFLFVVGLAVYGLPAEAPLRAQPPEVTGTFTINGTPHKLTHVYAFARKSGSGEDQGPLILFTSVPVPAEVIRTYVIDKSWVQQKALKGELVAIEVVVRPATVEEARTAAGARNCCQSNFFGKGLITEDRSLSISGTQQLLIAKSEPGRIAGRVQLPSTKNAPGMGGGATIQYDVTFNTRILVSKSMMGPWGVE